MIWRKTIRSPAPGMGTSGTAHVLIYTGLGEELEELEFTEGAEAEEGVLEGKDLLDGDLSVGGLVEGGYDGAVGTFTESLHELETTSVRLDSVTKEVGHSRSSGSSGHDCSMGVIKR